MNPTIQLGQECEDRVSGFRGIATARIEFLNGCVQYCLVPKAKDNKKEDGLYFDVAQLKVIGRGITVEAKKTGGPTPANTPTSYRA